jgi:hypothetical protein
MDPGRDLKSEMISKFNHVSGLASIHYESTCDLIIQVDSIHYGNYNNNTFSYVRCIMMEH